MEKSESNKNFIFLLLLALYLSAIFAVFFLFFIFAGYIKPADCSMNIL